MTRSSRRVSSASKKRGQPSSTSTPQRQSKRLRASDRTTKSSTNSFTKSKYFEDNNSQSSDKESKVEDEDEESGYEEAGGAGSPPQSESSDANDEDTEEEVKAEKKRHRNSKSKSTPQQTSKGRELWRTGVKTGLGPGKEVFIKLPKARSPGKVLYKDNMIHPNTMLFLGELGDNNEREWFKMHDPDYRESKKDFDSFVECLTEKVIEKDETIPELPPKDITFRIYRDIRFSSDPTPYKPYFSAAWSRTGRKGPYAAYYVQIAPGKCFVGGGLWMPEAQSLDALRSDIDRKPHKIKRVLTDAGIRKEFFSDIPNDENKAVKAFISQNTENALKTKPRGFEITHPNIELLRLRNYTLGKKLSDSEVIGPKGLDRIAEIVGVMVPFITYLNSVVRPDGEPSSDEEETDEEDNAN
ncbi:MAG: hypothetical protein M1834_009294 [Cirrosporium novae-zelandiae]|nr:MAG: hypothetical protein M1834_009294 [Cirrosporium novae-zelandiae]